MSGRSIIVTGGFGALGRTVAAAFAAQGDSVARIDAASTAADTGFPGTDLGGVDLTDADACARAIDAVADAHGGIDVLVNIAGGFIWQTLEDGDPAHWQRMYAANVLTAATMSRAALPMLRKSETGRIVFIGANAAIRADAGMGAYAAAKSGVHRLVESLAVELAGSAVTANAVMPSIIDTPANRAEMPDADTTAWVKAEAIADVILFLASDAARSINGALVPVTRGTPR